MWEGGGGGTAISEDFSCIGYHLTEYGGVFGD